MEVVVDCSKELVVDLSNSNVSKVKFINTSKSIMDELWLENNNLTSLRLPVKVNLINVENNPKLDTVEFHSPGRCGRIYLANTMVAKIKGIGNCAVMSYNPHYKAALHRLGV